MLLEEPVQSIDIIRP